MILIYSKKARDQICVLPPDIKQGIRKVLDDLYENPALGKPLQRELTGFYSLPFKRYRVIYKIVRKEIQIYSLGHRENIYEEFAKESKFT